MSAPEPGQKVLVTTNTDRRGVFAGQLEEFDRDRRFVVLSEARMVVKWSSDVRGVLGLCDKGPTEGCRISPATERIELDGVTSVSLVSEEAWERFEEEPWE